MALWCSGNKDMVSVPMRRFDSLWCQFQVRPVFLLVSYMALWFNGKHDLISAPVSGFESHWCRYSQAIPLFMKKTSSDMQTWASMVYWDSTQSMCGELFPPLATRLGLKGSRSKGWEYGARPESEFPPLATRVV